MTFQISVMTNYRTASHFRQERSRSLSLAYINTMSEQPEVFRVLTAFFNSGSPCKAGANAMTAPFLFHPLLLWLWRQGEITYFWISKTSCPIIRTQMTFEISLTFILLRRNWITDICNCHLRWVTSWMSVSVTSLQISVIQFRLVKRRSRSTPSQLWSTPIALAIKFLWCRPWSYLAVTFIISFSFVLSLRTQK